MKTEQPNPHPILPWHREAANAVDAGYIQAEEANAIPSLESTAAIIASHDPHAETLRLLELTEARLRGVNNAFNSAGNDFMAERCAEYANEIRAHLAAMQKSAKQEGTQ